MNGPQKGQKTTVCVCLYILKTQAVYEVEMSSLQ